MGTLLFVVVVTLVIAVLLGAGGYSVRRYWSPAGSEVMETSEATGSGVGAGIAASVLALLVLILLIFGVSQWNWFGARSTVAPANNPTVTSPAPTTNSGAGSGGRTVASPSASAIPSPT